VSSTLVSGESDLIHTLIFVRDVISGDCFLQVNIFEILLNVALSKYTIFICL
jgi:hypothetical protein